ncbi:DnaJ subfamily C member 2 [Gossypium arboreum]|uniref:DnaJ subfamily C member 2 n=1 Tax=Gossypium arboreum TaxID=29729 RepID=A0A0B0P5Y8_GOSAR|nr:DnaJ subfamily C member 2 [Gossypium arboreum]
MDRFPDVLCGWSWEENKLFELALAVVDEQHPDRWEVVAAMVGGEKTAEDVHKHYVILLEDLQFIESGKLDHKLAETQSCIQLDCTQSLAGSIRHKMIPRATVLLVYYESRFGHWWLCQNLRPTRMQVSPKGTKNLIS